MKVDIEEFKKHQEYIESINNLDYKDIEIEGVEVSEDVKKRWRFIGLNNISYIEMLLDQVELHNTAGKQAMSKEI